MEKTIYTLRRSLNLILGILFPSRCIGCNIRGEIICSNCIDSLKLAERQTEENIIALYDYRDPLIKKAIWKLKYHHSPYLGKKFGEMLYESMLEEIDSIKTFSKGSPIFVIPIPISKNKYNKRGYNQSEIIARAFCCTKNDNIIILKTNILYKKLNTIPQARLTNRNKRLKNIKGAFEIKNSESIKGKTLIVIDDVTTTGGTMLEAIKVLKKSGAKKVVGIAVAH
ncbi:MAG: phosphoribosyltransferase family protein [Candidatus Nomurabacteria bacterium]